MLETILLSLSVIINFVFIYKYYNLSKFIIKLQEDIEAALDIIDYNYKKIDEITKRDLFIDTPEVRQVHESLKHTKDVIHNVALLLTDNFGVDEEKEENVDEN